MTSLESGTVQKAGRPGPLRWLISSMWTFWFFLLTVSFGLATGIYYIWLRGNL
jgi:hypothetical protein